MRNTAGRATCSAVALAALLGSGGLAGATDNAAAETALQSYFGPIHKKAKTGRIPGARSSAQLFILPGAEGVSDKVDEPPAVPGATAVTKNEGTKIVVRGTPGQVQRYVDGFLGINPRGEARIKTTIPGTQKRVPIEVKEAVVREYQPGADGKPRKVPRTRPLQVRSAAAVGTALDLPLAGGISAAVTRQQANLGDGLKVDVAGKVLYGHKGNSYARTTRYTATAGPQSRTRNSPAHRSTGQ